MKKNIPLLVGIALPILFIVGISIAVFVPSIFINPQHNFIYTEENTYYGYGQGYRSTYKVENDRIVLEQLPMRDKDTYKGDAPTLYVYNIKTDTSHQISIDQADLLRIDPGPSSPDGYTVSYQYGHSGIFELFGSSSDSNGFFIAKDNGKKKLSGLIVNQGNFKLIGWVK